MVMDPGLRDLPSVMNGRIKLNAFHPNQNHCRIGQANPLPAPLDLNTTNPNARDLGPSLGAVPEEDSEMFSDITLKYISRMLMEEDMEEKSGLYLETSALQAAEKPFYDILGEKYPPSPDPPPLYSVDHNSDGTDDYVNGSNINCNAGSNSGSVDGSWVCDVGDYHPPSRSLATTSSDYTPQSSHSSSGGVVIDGLGESPKNRVQALDFASECLSVWQFNRGVEEASKFLPNGINLALAMESNGFLFREPKEKAVEIKVKVEDLRDFPVNGSRIRKNPLQEDLDLEEGRSTKHSAIYAEDIVQSEAFDKVLLCNGRNGPLFTLRTDLLNALSKNSKKVQPKGSNGSTKSRGKKHGKKEVVDLRTLLIRCAQAVAADDGRNASELLKQIRQHSSPFGDGSQRLAHYFANGLEARLAGTGSQIYMALSHKRTTAADMLKAYHLYLAACPFKKVSHFFANQTIVSAVENSTRLHIIDFGIYFGFQWPPLLQRLSKRDGGPPKIRITGIDFPQPGFRPAQRVEDTGRRLADYAQRFGIPFEYIPIVCKWETVQVEDLKIDRDEVLVVNILFRAKKMFDETVVVDSPRNIVLNKIRRMNPDVFIHGIVNGSFSAPFFITRFREALFHWSAMFDLLEMNVPRESPERILIEREIFGRESLNVIACEGVERIERPETYKQWHVRNLRAGFKQLPLNREIMTKARNRVKNFYHKDFVIDEDSQWMLQGWKGRIVYAISTWKPDHERF